MPINNTFVIDIDDTLIVYPDTHKFPEARGGAERYPHAIPDHKEIEMCNNLYAAGYTIILLTGRGWHQYTMTKEQLKSFGIQHHELVMGKIHGTYIDRDFLTSLQEVTIC